MGLKFGSRKCFKRFGLRSSFGERDGVRFDRMNGLHLAGVSLNEHRAAVITRRRMFDS